MCQFRNFAFSLLFLKISDVWAPNRDDFYYTAHAHATLDRLCKRRNLIAFVDFDETYHIAHIFHSLLFYAYRMDRPLSYVVGMKTKDSK